MSRFSKNNGDRARKVPLKLVLILLLNTLVLFGTYAYFVMRRNINWLFWVYFGALLVSALAYILYNRAFSDADCTFYSLPNDWSDQKKNDFLFARDERKRKSKWLLTIVFPLCICLLFDTVNLFFGDWLSKAANAILKGLGL